MGQSKALIHHKPTTITNNNNTEQQGGAAQSNPAMEKSSEMINGEYSRKRNTNSNPQELCLDIASSPLKKAKSDEITTNRSSSIATMPGDATDDNLSETALSADGRINLAPNRSENNANHNKSSPAAPVPNSSLNRPGSGSAENESNNIVRKARVSVRARCEAPMVIINSEQKKKEF